MDVTTLYNFWRHLEEVTTNQGVVVKFRRLRNGDFSCQITGNATALISVTEESLYLALLDAVEKYRDRNATVTE